MWKRIAMVLALVAVAATFADAPVDAIGSTAPQDADHPDALVALADDYRAWAREDPEGVPDYAALARQRADRLAEFKQRLADIDPSSWSVHAKIDYLVLQIEMDRQDFQLRVIRQPTRNPDFYVSEAVSGVTRHIDGRYVLGDGIQAPYDEERGAAIIAALRQTPEILDRGPEGLVEGVPEMADMALERLDGIEGKYDRFVEILSPRMPESQRGELAEAAEVAGTAMAEYRDWLMGARADMSAPYAVGAEAFQWLARNVYVYPYTNEELLQQAESERLRSWASLQFERQKNKNLPRPGGVASDLPTREARTNDEYTAWNDATDVLAREWAEKIEFFTTPGIFGPMRHGESVGYYLDPFGFMSFPTEDRPEYFEREFLEEPDSWYVKIYWNVGHRIDPGTNHAHSHWPGHTFEGIVSDRLTCAIRAPHNTRGDAWTTYIEEVQLQTDYPFLRGDLVREWMYSLAIMRAERVWVAVKFASGDMTPDEVAAHMMETVPWMEPYVARHHEVWRRFRRPAHTLTYQVGKNEIFKLMRDRMRQLGDEFDFRTFHDELLATGQIPIALARWEMAGIDDDAAHLWDRPPIPEEATMPAGGR